MLWFYNQTMNILHSKDNTPITYQITGSGPLLIIITGALNTHNFGVPSDIVPLLRDSFSILTYDRRGRGKSGDSTSYTVFKEIGDIEALIDNHGGNAYLYGHSAGAALALFAAAELPEKVIAVAAYEPPLSTGCLNDLSNKLLIREVNRQIKNGEQRDVVLRFMRFVGMSEAKIDESLSGEHGKTLIEMASTIAYEARIQTASRSFLKSKAPLLTQPVLMLAGDKSFKTAPGIMQSFAVAIPMARSKLLPGQSHSVDAETLAPILREFYLGL